MRDALAWNGADVPQDTSNDNDLPRVRRDDAPDAHGLAALLLVESLIHALIARSAMTVAEAVDVVAVAAEVQAAMLADERYATDTLQTSAGLVDAIAKSLSRDLEQPV